MKCAAAMAMTAEYVNAAAAVAAGGGEAPMLVDSWREAERVTLWGSAEGDKGGGQLSICCDQSNVNIYWKIQLRLTLFDTNNPSSSGQPLSSFP